LALTLLLVFSTVPAFAQGQNAGQTFNWHANANKASSQALAIAKAQAAIRKARNLSKGATWVCSPSGSGRTSTCYKG
jgi:type II secretory ATPase GspE/PulE/Tfp pilus assembly ATPase PilB-like protein